VSEPLEVWLDADFVPERQRVGTLAHDRGTVRFHYDPSWLQHDLSFALDPDLSLGEGVHYPKPEQGNFRIFDDSAPDRWGQMLMKRADAPVAHRRRARRHRPCRHRTHRWRIRALAPLMSVLLQILRFHRSDPY
jgi:hypothetical protein